MKATLAVIRWRGADSNEGEISNTPPHAPLLKLKCGQCRKPNNRSRIGSNAILKFGLGLTQPYKTGL
jgi:hypothetical protein